MHGTEQKKYSTGFCVCSPLHLMYSSLPWDTSSQQCNDDFLKCVERPFPCAFRWSLKLFIAAHILGVKAGAPTTTTFLAPVHCGQLLTLSENHHGVTHMCVTQATRDAALCFQAPAPRKWCGKSNWLGAPQCWFTPRVSTEAFLLLKGSEKNCQCCGNFPFSYQQGASYPDTTAGLLTLF